MPKQITYRLNETEWEAIRTAMKSNEHAEVSRRATAIHMLHLGHRPEEVAQVLAVSPATIYNWHGRWRKHGVDGLVNGTSSGRPRKASAAYVRLLEETLEREPQEVGQDFTVWTIERLIDYLAQQTGIRLSPGRFGVLLKEQAYVYRRPKHDLKELQDPQARAQAQTWLDELKKGALAGEYLLFFVDESTFGLHPVLRKCWMKRGRQKRVPTPGKQVWHHVFAAYNYVSDEVISYHAEHKNSSAFIAFLDHLVQTVDSELPIVLVLDNASYHTSRATQAAFACFQQRILPLFLPAYCSDLNPIERFWRHLKETACANTLFHSIQHLIASVTHWLTRQNDLRDPARFLISKAFQ